MAQGRGEGPEDAALHARLGKLSSALDTRDKARTTERPIKGDRAFGNAMGAGLRVVAELIGGVVVGGGLGYLLDKWLHTKPLFLILLLALGLAGGFWNIVRTSLLPPRGPGSGI